jgi:hypothetical protein
MLLMEDSDFKSIVQNLLDRMCQFERSTGITTVLIMRDDRDDQPVRAIDGVRAYVPENYTDEEVLKLFRRWGETGQ